jgi:hypothetical protein
MRRVPSALLVYLLILLPLLALITAQFSLDCHDCVWWRDAVTLLTYPIALLWLAALIVLLWRGGKKVVTAQAKNGHRDRLP